MANSHQREVAVFEAALQLPPEQREAYLDHACGDDPELRDRIRGLLRAHQDQTDLLEPSVRAAFDRDALPAEKPGDQIGPYKLLQQIGEGGCGVVYMAEQAEPIQRRVALKIIKLGMDTKQVVARFDAERHALALMDHPNIARVLDAGATETGRPYFVMELVRGVKITDYCDQNHLSTPERLELFIQVCHAVQHAHQKGIIHRDLKPSNILVTNNDGVAVPKVIDFGIAKATQGRLTDQTVFTAFEQFIGTPAYMSPEQAAITSVDIDTRSDIYSLGVLLYELLTGKTPFDTKELLAAGLDQMRRTICETQPARPSTRLSTLGEGELTTAAQRRKVQPPELMHLVRDDLDWIVMKCLEKDRGRRYETASGLAMDIQRHLDCEPVLARPPSRLYEFQKTVRRHKFGFGAAAALIVVLAAGVIVSTREAIRARRAEREAQAETLKSKQTTQSLYNLLDGFVDVLCVDVSRDTNMFNDVLPKIGRSLNEHTISGAFKENSDAQFLLGLMYLHGQGVPKNEVEARKWLLRSAEQHNVWAEDYLGTMYQDGDGVPKDAAESLKWFLQAGEDGHHGVENQLGKMYKWGDGVPKDAVEAAKWFLKAAKADQTGAELELVRIYKTGDGLPKNDAEALKWERKLAKSKDSFAMNDAAWMLATSPVAGVRDGKAAITLAEEAVSLTSRANASFVDTLAAAYAETGDFAKAVAVEKESIALLTDKNAIADYTQRLKLYEANIPYRDHYELADRIWDLLKAGKFAEAELPARECLRLREKFIPEDWHTFNAESMLGGSLLGQKKYSEAEPFLLSGYEGLKQREDQIPTDYRRIRLKEALERLVQLYQATGQTEKAAAYRTP